MNARTPPAFIPTLTRQLHEHDAAALQAAPLLIDLPLLDEEVLPPEALHAWAGAKPQAQVTNHPPPAPPQLQPAAVPPPAAAPAQTPAPQPASAGIDDSASQAEHMRSRLLQRVDIIVQRRVREAAAAIALEHAQSLLQDLRPALEKAITEAVDEALALELASRQSAAG